MVGINVMKYLFSVSSHPEGLAGQYTGFPLLTRSIFPCKLNVLNVSLLAERGWVL